MYILAFGGVTWLAVHTVPWRWGQQVLLQDKKCDPPVYEGVEIAKLECCGHVQKGMGRQLMNKVSELQSTTFNHNGKQVKSIGLKKTVIMNIYGHFGAAIKNNVGNVPTVKKAVMAIWEHRNKKHINCSQWCPTNKQNGSDPNKNSPPPPCYEGHQTSV